jgi:hypothetical protein
LHQRICVRLLSAQQLGQPGNAGTSRVHMRGTSLIISRCPIPGPEFSWQEVAAAAAVEAVVVEAVVVEAAEEAAGVVSFVAAVEVAESASALEAAAVAAVVDAQDAAWAGGESTA